MGPSPACRSLAARLVTVASVIAWASTASYAAPSTDAAHPARNLFEWMAVAPIVVAGEVVAPDRKLVSVRVDNVVRGDVEEGSTILIDQGRANRERRDGVSALTLEETSSYLFLLGEPTRQRRGSWVYPLVRDVSGARPLPEEGREAWIDAAFRLGRLQAVTDDSLLWRELGDLLASRNPLVASTALDLHLKFARGGVEILPAVRSLMADPRPDFRRRATELAGDILARIGWRETPGGGAVVEEVLARSRSDSSDAVRAAAVHALADLEGPEIDAALRRIAKDDPEQSVRYQAERAIFERSKSRQNSEAAHGGD